MYYLRDTFHGPRLVLESRSTSPEPVDAAVRQALSEAVAGAPRDPDYATLWPPGTQVRRAMMSGGAITVALGGTNLRDRPAGITREEAEASLQQVLYTAQAGYQSPLPVRFLLDGRRTDTVLGVPTARPVAQGDELDVVAHVWTTFPQQGATVHSPVTVQGKAAAGAPLAWELKQGDRVVRKGAVAVTGCCAMAPYSFMLPAPPGRYTLLVRSGAAVGGRRPWQDTKDITIE